MAILHYARVVIVALALLYLGATAGQTIFFGLIEDLEKVQNFGISDPRFDFYFWFSTVLLTTTLIAYISWWLTLLQRARFSIRPVSPDDLGLIQTMVLRFLFLVFGFLLSFVGGSILYETYQFFASNWISILDSDSSTTIKTPMLGLVSATIALGLIAYSFFDRTFVGGIFYLAGRLFLGFLHLGSMLITSSIAAWPLNINKTRVAAFRERRLKTQQKKSNIDSEVDENQLDDAANISDGDGGGGDGGGD